MKKAPFFALFSKTFYFYLPSYRDFLKLGQKMALFSIFDAFFSQYFFTYFADSLIWFTFLLSNYLILHILILSITTNKKLMINEIIKL